MLTCFGYGVLALVLWIAWAPTALLMHALSVGALLSISLGLGCTLATAYYRPGALRDPLSPCGRGSREAGGEGTSSTVSPLIRHCVPPSPSRGEGKTSGFSWTLLCFRGYAHGGSWLLSSLALCLLSYYFFGFLERTTHLNPRLYELASGTILGILKQHALSLGLVPWLLYVFLGLGLAYATLAFRKRPFLSELCLLSIKDRKIKAVFHSLLAIPLELLRIGWCVLTASFMALWFMDWILSLLDLESLYLRPLRLIFMGGLIMVVLRKPTTQLLRWMEKSHASIGTLLLLYLGLFSFFLFWLHATADAISLGSETTQAGGLLKSVLAGALDPAALETHLGILMLGWWSLWLPWMVSQAAKTALGGSMLGALLKLIIAPLLIFGVAIPCMSTELFLKIGFFLDHTGVQAIAWCALCLWLRSIWGSIRVRGDLERGAMISPRTLSKRPLNRWMMVVFGWISYYLLGYFILGWRLSQWILGAAACVTVGLALVFSVAWVSSLIPAWVLKKYRFLGSV